MIKEPRILDRNKISQNRANSQLPITGRQAQGEQSWYPVRLNARRLVINLSEGDYSRIKSISDCLSIPIPILCRVFLKEALHRYSTGSNSDGLLISSGNTSFKASFSKREMEILNLMVQGMSNREIAGAHMVSEQTVKNHIRSILSKMKVSNRTQAALIASRHIWSPSGIETEENPAAVGLKRNILRMGKPGVNPDGCDAVYQSMP